MEALSPGQGTCASPSPRLPPWLLSRRRRRRGVPNVLSLWIEQGKVVLYRELADQLFDVLGLGSHAIHDDVGVRVLKRATPWAKVVVIDLIVGD